MSTSSLASPEQASWQRAVALLRITRERLENEKARFSSKNAVPSPEELEALRSASLKVTLGCGAGAPGAMCEIARSSSENGGAVVVAKAAENEKARISSEITESDAGAGPAEDENARFSSKNGMRDGEEDQDDEEEAFQRRPVGSPASEH